jgi:L,D-peptidoglycan transpeptidase YkuD (ErfK/YbiS/YcfS/YnhG family)
MRAFDRGRGRAGTILFSILAMVVATIATGFGGTAAGAAAASAAATPTAGSRQVIAVSAPAAGSSQATLNAWQRNSNGSWTRILGPVAARVGSAGVGAAREGSRLTPAGTFALDQAFGRLADPGTRLPYFKTDRLDWWDENPASATYNLHVRRSSSPGGASENLYAAGTAYNYAINCAYNPSRIPGKGSAFFLHVGTGSATAGCVSIDQGAVRTILRWLDPRQHPVIDIRIGAAWAPKTPTTLTQTTPARTVASGTTTSLTGALVSATGQRLGGMTTQIWARAHGGVNWAHLGNARTAANGSYRYTFVPNGAKDYQVRWPGGGAWSGSSSRVILIRTV